VNATICLSHILDINPALTNKLISYKGVEILCNNLQNIEYIDLVEWIVKTLDKVSLENSYSILSCNAILYLLNIIDFFDFTVQVQSVENDIKFNSQYHKNFLY